MASDYGLNFGFRRSDESMAVREGRYKTPVGSALRLGTCVEIDAATGYLKQSAANVAPLSGIHGLLVQEEDFIRGIYQAPELDSYDLGVALPDKLSVLWSGRGTKVWFRNSGAITRADGRAISAVTIITMTGLVVGDGLGWSGSAWVKSDGTTIPHVMRCTVVSGTGVTGYAEAVLQF